jgi:2-oxoglutarate/2-oxoacid ferredoxin oxidoreductase subunit alpha
MRMMSGDILQGRQMLESVSLLNSFGGKKYGALIFGDIWPLPETKLREKAKKAEQIINIEQNATGQLASIKITLSTI